MVATALRTRVTATAWRRAAKTAQAVEQQVRVGMAAAVELRPVPRAVAAAEAAKATRAVGVAEVASVESRALPAQGQGTGRLASG